MHALPPPLATGCADALARWQRENRVDRLWHGDATLWTGADEARWLGWLETPATESARCADYLRFAAEARAGGVTHALWAGIGGSALAVRAYAALAPAGAGVPIRVLDTLVTDDLIAAEREAPAANTLAAFASKSGTTLETRLLMARLTARIPPSRCIALTDPGTPLETDARAGGFARVFHGEPAVGGRYSALTAFGLVAAALSGYDLDRLLAGAAAMAARCRGTGESNPGLALGLLLGTAALLGRDKLVLLASPRLAPFASWIEQLVAESTGKDGRGMVPVTGSSAALAAGADRLVARFSLRGESAPALPAGVPAIEFAIEEAHDLGAEFFRWMFATAVAGSVLGVHPFDQPDVEASKIAAHRHLAPAGAKASPAPPPILAATTAVVAVSGLAALAGTGTNGAADAETKRAADAAVRALLGSLRPGDHLALLCWMPATAGPAVAALQARLTAATGAAVSAGFGPRYLHSTGQLHKGGPDRTACLMLTTAPAKHDGDEQWQGFAEALAAQAAGDAEALAARGRRLVWLRLAAPLDHALAALAALATTAD